MLAADKSDLDALLVGVGRKDHAAFAELYRLMSPKLLSTILRIVKVRAAAEEVLQDVFLRIWQNASVYSPETAPAGAWMNSIARNRAIDVVRQKGFTSTNAPDTDTDWYERIAEDRDREADVINNASMRRCLQTIEPQARDCVLLAYYEGYSREELARRYERPVNTIKTWLHRSLSALRVCLDGEGS